MTANAPTNRHGRAPSKEGSKEGVRPLGASVPPRMRLLVAVQSHRQMGGVCSSRSPTAPKSKSKSGRESTPLAEGRCKRNARPHPLTLESIIKGRPIEGVATRGGHRTAITLHIRSKKARGQNAADRLSIEVPSNRLSSSSSRASSYLQLLEAPGRPAVAKGLDRSHSFNRFDQFGRLFDQSIAGKGRVAVARRKLDAINQCPSTLFRHSLQGRCSKRAGLT